MVFWKGKAGRFQALGDEAAGSTVGSTPNPGEFMSENHHPEMMSAAPARVGVIPADLGKLNVTALKYLVVHLNTLQASIEFEILALGPGDELLMTLDEGDVVERDKCRSMLPGFSERITRLFGAEQKDYDLADQSLPENFVVISLAKFSDEHYGLKEKNVQVQALGNWARHMAPPSILEFILVLLMRQAASFIVPALSKSLHLGTKGCLFDFTSDLAEARYKALQSFVCSTCRSRIQESGAVYLADDIVRVLDFNWLGTTSDPHCPAGIVAKLGYDLFLTKGIQPTFWENIRAILRDEGMKEIIKLVFAILLVALLLKLASRSTDWFE